MQLAYRRPQERHQGAGQVPPLVFLHAFPVDGRMWRGQLQELGRLTDVIAPDFRGFGGSPPGDGLFSIALFSEDVVETLEAMAPRPGPVIFAGCSLGGYVIFELWRRRPDLVAGMILCDTRAEADTEETRGKRREQIAKIRTDGTEFLPRLMSQNLLSARTRERHPDLVQEVRGWMSEPAPDVLIRTLEALGARPDSTATLPTISVPALVIVGDQDSVTPREAAVRMQEGIPGAELAEIPDAGHLAPLENAPAVNRAIEDWIRKHYAG